jgi:Fe-Mn family superoxide dismutase
MKMTYSAKNYDRLLGLRGFSDETLKTHFKLYEGYVLQVNRMIHFLKGANRETPEVEEVRRALLGSSTACGFMRPTSAT